LKFEYLTLFEIRRYQITFQMGKSTWYLPLLKRLEICLTIIWSFKTGGLSIEICVI